MTKPFEETIEIMQKVDKTDQEIMVNEVENCKIEISLFELTGLIAIGLMAIPQSKADMMAYMGALPILQKYKDISGEETFKIAKKYQ